MLKEVWIILLVMLYFGGLNLFGLGILYGGDFRLFFFLSNFVSIFG